MQDESTLFAAIGRQFVEQALTIERLITEIRRLSQDKNGPIQGTSQPPSSE